MRIVSNCGLAKGRWNEDTDKCDTPNCGGKKFWSDVSGRCMDEENISAKTACETPVGNGIWKNNTCDCSGDRTWNPNKLTCESNFRAALGAEEEACEKASGKWTGTTCECQDKQMYWNTKQCVACPDGQISINNKCLQIISVQ